MLVAYFAGTAEGAPDNAIRMVRLSRTGNGWTPSTEETMSSADDAHWNPVLAPSPSGDLALFYKRGRPISRWHTCIRRSTDGGATWSKERELVAGNVGGRGPVKNPPLITRAGTWVAGASIEAADKDGVTARWDCFADVSIDAGKTWEASGFIPIEHDAIEGPGIIQPTVWEAADHLTFLMRSSTGRAWRSESYDQGRNWAPAEPTTLPNNNSGLCAVRFAGGRVVAIHNTSSIPWGPRNELVASVSDDDGRTWRQVLMIDHLPKAKSMISPDDGGVRTDGAGELSYPTVRLAPEAGSTLVVSYTRGRRQIVVATIDLADSSAGKDWP